MHAALRAIEINTPDTITHDFLVNSVHEPIDSFPAVLVKWNAQARTENLQTGVNLRTNSKRHSTHSLLDGSLLLDGQDAFQVDLAVQIVPSAFNHTFLGVFLHRKRNIAAAPKPIQ